ncbi:hypothetical protein BDZ94DRAFT_1261135 [Collybia nuda]|uniref:Uncharacterized protein n=1 Tax=Collybia nuda TaxID=64659 RepID=A0A9P5Y6F2_9AGAR|nr:hypothetical protein BDZ94DRAFT_1261135 [Collybia nuda]
MQAYGPLSSFKFSLGMSKFLRSQPRATKLRSNSHALVEQTLPGRELGPHHIFTEYGQ